MSKLAPMAVVALAIVTISIVGWAMWTMPGSILTSEPSAALGPTPASGVATVTIKDGEAARKIAEDLQDAGVIQSARLFRVLVAFMGLENQLQAGDYEFDKGMTTLAAIDRIHNGRTAPLMVTIPEGLRVEEIAALLDAKGVVSKDDFMNAVEARRAEAVAAGDSSGNLEGYLFPATYGFSRSVTADKAVQQMLDAFNEQVLPEVQPQLATAGLTLDQVLTLASIVEREAVKPEERPLIASVYLNRLNSGMALEADPTVQYAVGSDPQNVAAYGYWKKELSADDLKVDSPYNTYVNQGLPPGPIACPGLDSVRAVLNPAQTNYLYFVAKGDGSHVFAETLEEHLRNVQLYQR
jgi:UPF0755 protein